MFVHQTTIEIDRMTEANISISNPRAQDRRKALTLIFGNWFSENRMKLGRDYLVNFSNMSDRWPQSQWVVVQITLLHSSQATLFKLTWGGK